MPTPEIETLDSRVVYENRWMQVREDRIRRADGSDGLYGVVDKPDFAVIAAVHAGHIFLVEQYRYPVRARFWELPQGSWGRSGSDPLAQAQAELREETGLRAGSMQHIAKLHEAYGYSTQAFDLYLATDLSRGAQALEPEEAGLVCREFPIAQVQQMICDGVVADAVTVASFGLLRLRGLL